MIDCENEIYTTVKTKVEAVYKGIHFTSEPTYSPAEFPCVALYEADNSSYDKTKDSSGKENHAQVMYEAYVFSNKKQGRKTECKNIFKVVRKYINKYADELKMHINMQKNEKETDKDERDYHFTMDEIVKKFKNNLSQELGIDNEEIIANYVIKVSYKNFSMSKSFVWAAYADYIIKNLKNNSNPKRNISIVEVPYKTNDSYEYLGKFYEFKAVNEYR